MSESFGRGRIQDLAREFANNLGAKFQGKQAQAEATITSVTRDAAGRATGAVAIVDGVAAQAVAIDHGARIAPGDVWQVRNQAGAALPRWVAERRLKAAAEVQAPDALPTLPTPTGLAVLSDLYRTAPGGEWRAYLRCSWLAIGAQYRGMGYDVQYMASTVETLATTTATDRNPTTLLDGTIDDSQTTIPRDPDAPGYQDDFPSFGRIQIESEKVDYTSVTTGAGDSGAAGTGDVNSFTDAGKAWTPDEWAGYALTDSAGDVFLVTANAATVLTVAGTPASGAYTIKPAFSGCTRGAGGTVAAAHDDDTGVGSLSVGIAIPELPPDTDYNVRVRAHSPLGALSAWTAWASVTTAVDTTPPPVPGGMAYTPLTPSTVRLSWNKSLAPDLAYYEVAYSMAPGGLGLEGTYETVQTVNAFLDLGWSTNRALYWKVRAVDTWDNEGDYCAEQTAYTVSVALPELGNPFFEEGNGAPDDWTLDSDGPVTTTWIASGGWNNSKAIKIEIGAANGADAWFIALESALFAVQQGVEYLPPGAMTYFAAVTDNALAFTVYQYSDAIGTPATEPLVRQVVNQSSDRLNDWWHPGITAGGTYTVPAGSDVTHIAIAFEVNLDETHAQTVLLDNAVCDPVPAEMYKGVEAHATYHLPGGVDALATAAATTLTVATTNTEGDAAFFARSNHTHAITTSADPGAAAAILATDATGKLTLVRLNTDTLADKSGGNVTIAPAGDIVLDPTGNDVLPGTGYDVNLGMLTKKYLTLHAAELWVQTLVAQATMATVGGRILVGPTTRLAVDLGDSAGNTTITVEHNNLANGDRVVMQAAGKLEWMAVTSAAGGVGPYTYTVTRNLDGSGRNLWYAGDAVFNTGTTGDGHIDLYSVSGVIPGSTAGPTIVGNVRYGTTYSQIRPAWAIGNLNGLYGYAADVMGVALGQYSEADYITVDPTNGIRFFDSGDAVRAQLSAGAWTLGNASTEHVAISSTAVQIKDGATVLTNISGGNVLVGQTGAGQSNVYITSGAVQLRTNTTVNLELTTAGQIILGDDAGGEYVIIDSNGIEMYSGAVKVVDISNNGDFVFGQVAASKSNIFFDQSTGRLNFRGGAAGTTVQAYINTTGELMAGGGAVRINASGIQGYAGATQRFNLASDGSGWVGASDVLRWTTAGVVAFKAAGLVDPWETPSLTDALYMPNRYGGGQRMWAWEATWSQIQTCFNYKTFLISGGPFYTDYKCTATGGPYYDLDGGSNAMLIRDGGGATDGWQEPGGNNFFVWAWVNADTLATNSRTILAKWDYITGGNLSWVLYCDYTNSRFAFTVSSDGSDTVTVRDTNVPATGTWYFVAGFFQPSTRLRILVAPASAATLTATDNTTGIPAAIYDSSSPFALGMMASWASGAGFYWDGGIGVHSAYRGLPAATVTNYAQLLFEKTKQFYGG